MPNEDQWNNLCWGFYCKNSPFGKEAQLVNAAVLGPVLGRHTNPYSTLAILTPWLQKYRLLFFCKKICDLKSTEKGEILKIMHNPDAI